MYKKNKSYWLYLLPALIIITIFVLYPIINTILISFQDGHGDYSLDTLFDTYKYVLKQEKFRSAFLNTIIYALIVTPFTLIISIFLSYLLSLKIKFKTTFQTIYFLPYVTSTIAIAMVWGLLYHTNYGLINQALNSLGFESIPFLTDIKYSLLSLTIFGIWKGLAFNILILFTAIAGIDSTLEKAALVDGTSNFKTFFKIKLPQIYPVIIYLIIIGLIHSLKMYEEIVGLYASPSKGTTAFSLVYYIQEYITTDKAVAAVAAIMLLILTVVLTFFNRYITKFFSRRSK